MEHTAHTFDFSFRRKGIEGSPYPAFVVTVPRQYDSEVETRVSNIVRSSEDAAEQYFATVPPFRFGEPDLFGYRAFGYNGIGRIEQGIDGTEYIIECLSRDTVSEVVLTLSVILSSVMWFDEVDSSNREQFARFSMRTEPGVPYGHAVGGTIYAPMLRWLAYRMTLKKANGMRRTPSGVRAAMRELWRHIAPIELYEGAKLDQRIFDKDCEVVIWNDGRFSLRCLGSDLSIYPDHAYRGIKGEESVEFSCHNLDGAPQQLTLLAGFAMLWQTARAWNERRDNAR